MMVVIILTGLRDFDKSLQTPELAFLANPQQETGQISGTECWVWQDFRLTHFLKQLTSKA